MGLDWLPGQKPKAGHEAEVNELKRALRRWFCWGRKQKAARLEALLVDPIASLGAPIVGKDEAATAWAHQRFPDRSDQSLTLDQWLKQLHGLPVLELLRPCDGLPEFSNGGAGEYVGEESFRAQFLKDCVDIIGEELWNRCYEEMNADEAQAFAEQLLRKGQDYARSKSLDLDQLPAEIPEDDDTDVFRLHVICSAVRWAQFWSARGHGIAPWF